MNTSHRICTRCVMDTTDPDIVFAKSGICNRCRDYERNRATFYASIKDREQALSQIIDEIKTSGKGRDYDCILGVSGGVDSSYLAYTAKNLGLRPLAIHLDNGWNSELAVSNIENLLKHLNIDLFTHVLDWDEFRDLQLAFLKASTPDSEIPTDHAIRALLMGKAAEMGQQYILDGSNLATEGIVSPAWSRGHADWKYISNVHKQFGTVPLRKFPHFSYWDTIYFRFIKRQRHIHLLDYVDYQKNEALKTLQTELNYKPYPGKHHESVYTRFYQAYILPCKFGYDKRKWHLSDLIMSNQITRDQALAELSKPTYTDAEIRTDKIFVAKKLGVTEEEFDRIIALPPKTMFDYPNYETTQYIQYINQMWRIFRRGTRRVLVKTSRGV